VKWPSRECSALAISAPDLPATGKERKGEITMQTPRWRSRNRFLSAGAAASAVAVAVAGLAAPALARPSAPAAGTTVRGPGYPPPQGIYKPFTNCPLNNPLMHEQGQLSATNSFGGFAACVAGNAVTGSITLGNITTQVTEPVNVQFGFAWQPGDSDYPLPAYPPLAGASAILKTKPDLIPESLTTALSCDTATDATIKNICQTAETKGGAYNRVSALAQQAGQIRNFQLLAWTQPVKFKLINPLLGSNCYIGTDSNPVVLNPSLSVGPGGGLNGLNDPQPTVHPDTQVLEITGASASDSTFSAPGVVGCGPGGVANVAVDEALNASSGLPAASGNSLTLSGTFDVGVNFTPEDSSLTQPQDAASNLLAAFQASTNGEHSVKHRITMTQFKNKLHKK
jgi:hypothetical protein